MPDRLGTDGDHSMPAAPLQPLDQGRLGGQVADPLTDIGGILLEFTADRRQTIRGTDRFSGDNTHPTISDKTRNPLAGGRKPERQIRVQDLPASGRPAKPKHKASGPFKGTVLGINRLHIAVFRPSVRRR